MVQTCGDDHGCHQVDGSGRGEAGFDARDGDGLPESQPRPVGAPEPAGEKHEEGYPDRQDQCNPQQTDGDTKIPTTDFPASQIDPEHQAKGADERSLEAGEPLHGNCVEDQRTEGGPTGSDQEQTGDSGAEATGKRYQDEPNGQDGGADHHHSMRRAAVHPDGCQHQEQSSQSTRRAEKTVLPRREVEPVVNGYRPESARGTISRRSAATTRRRPSLTSGCRMNGDMPAIVAATEGVPRAQGARRGRIRHWLHDRKSTTLFFALGSACYEQSSIILTSNDSNPSSTVGASALRAMGRGDVRTGLSMLGLVKNAADITCAPATGGVALLTFQAAPF